MKMKRSKKLVGIFVMLMMVSVVTPIVAADSEDVTTTWIVPEDTTITISYPNSETKITFDATGVGKDFTDLKATAQTGALAALRITNNGNTALKINGSWTTDFPAGITNVEISIGDDTNTTFRYYTQANETTNQTWVASLATSGTEDFWFWSTGADVAETAGIDRTLRVYSIGV